MNKTNYKLNRLLESVNQVNQKYNSIQKFNKDNLSIKNFDSTYIKNYQKQMK